MLRFTCFTNLFYFLLGHYTYNKYYTYYTDNTYCTNYRYDTYYTHDTNENTAHTTHTSQTTQNTIYFSRITIHITCHVPYKFHDFCHFTLLFCFHPCVLRCSPLGSLFSPLACCFCFVPLLLLDSLFSLCCSLLVFWSGCPGPVHKFFFHAGRCHRPRCRASLNQAAVHGLHEGMRPKVEDEGGGDAPPSPCASQDDRDSFPTPRPLSLPVPSMPLPHVRGILQLVGEAIAAKGAGTFPQALRSPHVACAIGSWPSVAAVARQAEASCNASRVRSDLEPCTVVELRR